ncbi:tetratricopeptide repeat protein [Campylobacter sp. CCUG 57310]|uniref:tetratricopeptide repeat protein n=1 Tax=Campylobacter sp. CCUG 57310 TaxID=2517362 RepID=UPI00156342F0|nr:SEL1-like repeat protein [Campylobacter sp. CCUG 57310]QKF92630.1 Sel1 domain-containing protein [Campylobacter sp. CCUG 57310]
MRNEFLDSCIALGNLYNNSLYGAIEYEKAANLFTMACEGGYPGACMNLGFLYYEGKGVNKDKARANKLLKMGCDMGYEDSCEFYKRYEDLEKKSR